MASNDVAAVLGVPERRRRRRRRRRGSIDRRDDRIKKVR
jgi:hypothetical protein